MLTLDSYLTLDEAAVKAPNLCSRFSDDDLKRIGSECWQGYDADQQSRSVWLKRNEAGMNLALQMSEEKTFPWAGCANVAFPLVTIAAMQFHARAYPAIVGGDQIVKAVVFGDDPDGKHTATANRISTHMSWQLMYQDRAWEEQEDKAIFNMSIVGTNFKKSYYSAKLKHNVSELVLAKNLVMNYWAKSVEDCVRKTHVIPKFRNEVYENVMRSTWRDCLEEGWYQESPAPSTAARTPQTDRQQGVTPPQPDNATSFVFLEQHVWLDLDDDGYAEPYIITFEERSKYVVRIVTRFDSMDDIERIVAGPRKGRIIQITATEFFTTNLFIPSPDGGIYGIGFGVFLGPLNEATNSIVNMLLDAGTMQTTAGGFLARGAKIRGGAYAASPFEWKRVDSTGDDLRKSIFPLPVNAPSDVLFQLLSLLINYASRVAGTTDITVGENPGQNTPAQTTQTMVEMGQKIYTAIFKRKWRASKEEFRKLFKLNGRYLSPGQPQVGGATREDYQVGADSVCPVADPNVTSDTARLQMAVALKQAAMTTPGYDKDAVERRYLAALRIEAPGAVFKGTEGQAPPEDPKVTLEKLKGQNAQQLAQLQLQAAQQEFAATLMEEQRLNNAKITELMAKAQNESASAQTEQQYAQVAAINAQISLEKNRNEQLAHKIDTILKMAELQSTHALGVAALDAAKSDKKEPK